MLFKSWDGMFSFPRKSLSFFSFQITKNLQTRLNAWRNTVILQDRKRYQTEENGQQWLRVCRVNTQLITNKLPNITKETAKQKQMDVQFDRPTTTNTQLSIMLNDPPSK